MELQGSSRDPMFVPLLWRRWVRIPLGVAIMTGGAFVGAWIAEDANDWVGAGAGIAIGLYGALLAWEFVLLALALGALWWSYVWWQDASEYQRLGAGMAAGVAYLVWLVIKLEQHSSDRIEKLERRLADLSARIYQLEDR